MSNAKIRKVLLLLICAIALFVSGCSASTEIVSAESESVKVEPTPTPTPTAQPTSTPQPTPEPTAQPNPTAEPTAEPTPDPTAEPTATPGPKAEPAGKQRKGAVSIRASAPVRETDFDPVANGLDSVQVSGLSELSFTPNIRFAFAANKHSDETTPKCSEELFDGLITIDLNRYPLSQTLGHDVMGYPSGFLTDAPITQLIFDHGSPDGPWRARLTTHCEEPDGKQAFSFTELIFDETGQVIQYYDPALIRGLTYTDARVVDDFSTDDLTVEVQNDEDGERYYLRVGLDLVEGEPTESIAVKGSYTVKEFAWASHDFDELDPMQFEVASLGDEEELRTIAYVNPDDSDDYGDALGSHDYVDGYLCRMTFSTSGYTVWTVSKTDCRSHEQIWAGFIDAEGGIYDAHQIHPAHVARAINIDQPELKFDGTKDEEAFKTHMAALSPEGRIYIFGEAVRDGENTSVLHVIDIVEDPGFVLPKTSPVTISDEILFSDLHDRKWLAGTDPQVYNAGCGGDTLYAITSQSFQRVLPVHHAIDSPIQVIGSKPHETADDERIQVIVVVTTCPEEYEGGRIWYGIDRTSAIPSTIDFTATQHYVASVEDLEVNWADKEPELKELSATVILDDGSETEIVIVD